MRKEQPFDFDRIYVLPPTNNNLLLSTDEDQIARLVEPTEIAERDDNNDLAPKVAFALGVIHLLESEDLEGMKAARESFQAFSDEYPDGPYREITDRIILLLDRQILRAKQEQKRVKQLTQKVSEQEEVIQTLKYKIEKLEEIHRETEQKRHLLETE